MRKIFVLFLLVVASISLSATSDDQSQNTVKDQYRNLEVGAFTIEKGVDLPPNYFAGLPQEIVSELQTAKLFDTVVVAQDPKAGTETQTTPPVNTVLRMTGMVTAFHAGSRKGRYFGGAFNPGANTQIYAYVQFIDASTNRVVAENEVVGTLSGGVGGGDSKNVVHEFARSLADTMKLLVLERPQAPREQDLNFPADAVIEKIDLSEKTFDAAQAKMNELGTKGFRLQRFKTTSYETAILEMAQTSGTAQYQYVLYRAMLATNVQKELTNRSQEGYRYRPHTMIMLKNKIFVIAEKDPTVPAAKYEYRVHATMLQSSVEKDLRQDQEQGFTLIDCRKTMENHHLLLVEKKSE